jgi:hypothetical protein
MLPAHHIALEPKLALLSPADREFRRRDWDLFSCVSATHHDQLDFHGLVPPGERIRRSNKTTIRAANECANYANIGFTTPPKRLGWFSLATLIHFAS